MTVDPIGVDITSEIGKLEGVILHTPGHEVENMTPEHAQRALYSDVLNLSVANREYAFLKTILKKVATTFEVGDLLREVLSNSMVREQLIQTICRQEGATQEIHYLLEMAVPELARQLIEGVVLRRDNLTRYLSKERYAIRPLHNFFFTRDAAMALWDALLIGRMASGVRERESLIMETIFRHHPLFKDQQCHSLHPFDPNSREVTLEGGDLLVANESVLVVGTGARTSTQGIDQLIELLKGRKEGPKHVIVQELPDRPESFIHLDMTFTFLDRHQCMVYEPLILGNGKFHTIQITVDKGKVTRIQPQKNLLKALEGVGVEMKPILCGGRHDSWTMEREQWHSGANFFAFAPGQVIGYERNDYTLEEMARQGFKIIPAQEFIEKEVVLAADDKVVVTIPGAELARGGGGARCMTLPVRRQRVEG